MSKVGLLNFLLCRTFTTASVGTTAASNAFATNYIDSPKTPSWRRANTIKKTEGQFQVKLNEIAKPFNELVSILKNSPPSTIMGLGVKDTDFEATSTSNITKQTVYLDMLNQSQVKKHLIQEVMQMFCRCQNDTGSPEVQAAIWSVKIAALEEHVQHFKHDYTALRKIVEWKDKRRKILKYLKRVSLERYFLCLDRLALPHDLVESVLHKYPQSSKSSKESIKSRAR